MPSKAYYRFNQRISYYEADLELCDLLVHGFLDMPDSASKIAVALGSNLVKHPKLTQKNSLRTREVRGGHLRRTLTASFVKDLYEDFAEFLSETMMRAAQSGLDPERFIGDAKIDVKASEILGEGNWDAVVASISNKVFRSLENERNTAKLIEKAISRLGLNIQPSILAEAMPYLDARHLLVHQDGRADQEYKNKYPSISVVKGKIVMNRTFTLEAGSKIDVLAKSIDDAVIIAGLMKPEHLHS